MPHWIAYFAAGCSAAGLAACLAVEPDKAQPILTLADTDSIEVLSIAFSPDGKMFASSGRDSTVKLWNVESGKNVGELKGMAASISRTYRPNGESQH